MNPLIIGNLKVVLPIVQAGMGVCISLSQLASSVANQGGVGVISAVGIGMLEPDYTWNFKEANKKALRKEIRKARKLTSGVLGVNLMMAVSDYDDLIEIAINEEIDIIFLSAGLPLKIPNSLNLEILKKTNTKFIPKVSSAKAAHYIFKYWDQTYNKIPDGIAIEGPLAGGHLGFKNENINNPLYSLENLISETKTALSVFEKKYKCNIPLIAAGGISSGHDIYKYMKLGANAVKMGTKFIASHECDADIAFKESIIQTTTKDLVIMQSPVGMPARVVKNDFVSDILEGKRKPVKCPWVCLKTCNYKTAPFCIAAALFNAAQGKLDQGFSFAGEVATKLKRISSVKNIINNLQYEYFESEITGNVKHKNFDNTGIGAVSN